MAIYHFSAQIIQRSEGRSVVNAAAYRSGEKIKDERLNQTFNYKYKEVADSFILAPKDSPDWVHDRKILWNETEKFEKRKDSQLAREINMAFPKELNFEQQKELLENYVSNHFVEKGMVADCAIHLDNPENPHAHVILTMREVSKEGFASKKNRDWNHKNFLRDARKEWASHTNKSLEKANISARVDHRSYKDLGIEKIPQKHESVHARKLEAKGIETDVKKYNEEVKAHNKELEEINNALEEAQKDLAATLSAENDKEQKHAQTLEYAKEKKQKSLKEVSSKANDRIQLINEREEVREQIAKFDNQLQRYERFFKDLEELPKRINKHQKQLHNLKAQNPLKKLLKYKEYKNTQKSLKNEILTHSERLEDMKKQLPQIKENHSKLKQEKLNLSQKEKSLNKQMNAKLYALQDKSKSVELQ